MAVVSPLDLRDPARGTAIPLDFSTWMLISHWKRLVVPRTFSVE